MFTPILADKEYAADAGSGYSRVSATWTIDGRNYYGSKWQFIKSYLGLTKYTIAYRVEYPRRPGVAKARQGGISLLPRSRLNIAIQIHKSAAQYNIHIAILSPCIRPYHIKGPNIIQRKSPDTVSSRSGRIDGIPDISSPRHTRYIGKWGETDSGAIEFYARQFPGRENNSTHKPLQLAWARPDPAIA